MGFQKDLDEILSYLPREKQTLLFSATVPPELRKIMAKTMRPDFETVDCIQDGDASTHTNSAVPQTHVILPHPNRAVSAQLEIVRFAMREAPNDHKIIAFFPTAAQTDCLRRQSLQ